MRSRVTENCWPTSSSVWSLFMPMPKRMRTMRSSRGVSDARTHRTGDATGYACPTHGNFKVADTVFAEAKAKDYTREQWEAALEKAKERTEPEGWPLIITDDFF